MSQRRQLRFIHHRRLSNRGPRRGSVYLASVINTPLLPSWLASVVASHCLSCTKPQSDPRVAPDDATARPRNCSKLGGLYRSRGLRCLSCGNRARMTCPALYAVYIFSLSPSHVRGAFRSKRACTPVSTQDHHLGMDTN